MISLLIVDDEELVRKLLKRIIPWRDLGLEFAGEADTGAAALSLCEKLRPSIVVTDIRMPGVDGLALMRGLKKVSPLSSVIIISGYRDFEYAKESIQYGASAYLLKPIDDDELRRALSAIVEAKYGEEAASRNKRALQAENRRLQNALLLLDGPEPSPDPGHELSLSERAARIVLSDLAVQRSLEGIAEALDVTPSHLSTVFRRERGVGFADFCITARVERAKELLCSSNLKPVDIAKLLGYADPHYFSRVFKRKAGLSPMLFKAKKKPEE